jgi:hypothetical protein
MIVCVVDMRPLIFPLLLLILWCTATSLRPTLQLLGMPVYNPLFILCFFTPSVNIYAHTHTHTQTSTEGNIQSRC